LECNGPSFEFWAKGSGRSWRISLNQPVLFVGLLLKLLVSVPFVRKTSLSLVALHLFFIVFKLFIIIFILFFLLVAVDRGLTRCSRGSLNIILILEMEDPWMHKNFYQRQSLIWVLHQNFSDKIFVVL
jgi:hypothetical protein